MKQYIPGIVLCLAIAVPSWILGKLFPVIGGPVFAILTGMTLAPILKSKKFFSPGVAFTSKKILQSAVILLGFGMNLKVVVETGRQSLPVILATVSASLILTAFLYKRIQVPVKSAVLIGVGSSICGGSAIAATAPVIDADDGEIAQAISVIFLFNIAAALLFPSLGEILGLSNEGFGLFAGTAINDTSSVTAAAAAWDEAHGSNTLETATIVKLTRTLAIIPITLVLALFRTKKEAGAAASSSFCLSRIFPFFILFFLLASVATTLFQLPSSVTDPCKDLSKLFIIMAMGAIGINTNLPHLIRTGARPICLGLCCWAGITAVSLVMQAMLGIW